MTLRRVLLAALILSAARIVGAEAGTYQNPAPSGDLVGAAQELLSTRPDLQTVVSQLQLESMGHSAYLWPDEPSPLRGIRVGPFWLLAKPKGTVGPANLRVVINTVKRFVDPLGNELPNPKGAAAFQQTAESVLIIALEPPDPSLLGNWRLVDSRGPWAIMLSSARWSFGGDRRFHAVQLTGEGDSASLEGYFLNDKSKLTIGQVDSGTSQFYAYEVDAGILRVSTRDESGELGLEWVFERE